MLDQELGAVLSVVAHTGLLGSQLLGVCLHVPGESPPGTQKCEAVPRRARI